LGEEIPTGWVNLTFTKMTGSKNPGSSITLRAHVDDEMSYYAALAAKKLGFRPDQEIVVMSPAGLCVQIVGKTVGEVIRRHKTTHFNIATGDVIGR